MGEEFKPSMKHILMSREYYTGLKLDIERMKVAMSLEDARAQAAALLDKLKKKYDEPNAPQVRVSGPGPSPLKRIIGA